jgi:hypothetical protein
MTWKTSDGISYKQLQSWSSKRRSTEFPEPDDYVGRYTFYDPKKVLGWYRLWRKAHRGTLHEGLRR